VTDVRPGLKRLCAKVLSRGRGGKSAGSKMALTTRRQFVQQSSLAAAAVFGWPVRALVNPRGIFEAREQNEAPPDPAAVRKLAGQITGRIITPGAADYDAARLIFNRAFDQRPALIVRCAGASDVARSLEFAQDQNLRLAVRAGGHSRAGHSVCRGGVVIDLSGMRRVEVDAGKRVARAEAGSIHVCYFGDSQRGNDLLRPLRAPLKPVEDNLKRMSYIEAQAAGFLQAPFAHFQTNLFLPELSAPAIAAITTAIKNAPPQFRVLIVPFSGAITSVPMADTAFALRQPGYEVDIAGRWSDPSEKAGAVQWVRALRDHLQPLAHGVYVNQLRETSEELVREAYGSNYARLVEIKKKYDPDNVLRLNQNIKPA
jgi:hypothetical protein